MTHGTPFPYEPPQDGGARGPGAPAAGRTPGRRSRARRLLPLAVAAWAVLEVWLLILVGEAAGGLAVLALLVAGLVAGGLAVRYAGRRAWRELSAALRSQQAAGRDTATVSPRPGTGRSATVMAGGVLLMVPGLLTDLVGLLCLLPVTGRLLRRSGGRLVNRGAFGEAVRQAREAEERGRARRPDGKVVPGEVLRDDEPPAG